MQLINARRNSLAWLGTILAVLLLFSLVTPKHADAATSIERSMVSLINRARVSHGRAPLRLNNALSDYARRHSSTMAARKVLYHNPYLAQWLRNWSWSILGENVGVGTSVPALHNAFMNSPHHRANIMDRQFRDVGVGVVVHGGRTWVTVIFRG